MKTLLTLLAVCFLKSTAFAQAPAIQWQTVTSQNDASSTGAYSIDTLANGSYIVAGVAHHLSTSSKDDYFIAKLNSHGAVEWQKTYGGSEYDDATCVKTTKDRGYIMAGYSTSFDGDLTGNHGKSDIWIVKLDSSGSIQWQKCYGSPNYEIANAIQLAPDGGYIFVGQSADNGVAYKIDSVGNEIWHYSYSGQGLKQVLINDIEPIPGGGYIMAGYSVVDRHIQSDFWIAKIDSLGKSIWQKTYGGNGDDVAESIQLAADGGYFVAGYEGSNNGLYKPNHGNYDNLVIKLDSTGAAKWQKCLGGSNEDKGYSLVATPDGGCIAVGESLSNDGQVTGSHGNYDCWMVKLDSSGNIIWDKAFGGSKSDGALDIKATTDGGFIMVGGTSSSDGDVINTSGKGGAWIVKLAPEALPVTFSNFTAQTKQPNVLLKWQTATEQNSKLFNIQRSTNGQQFTNIGTVAAAGSSNTLRTYNYTDNNVLALNESTLYYRIEEMDNDGKKMYSKIVTVSNTSQHLAFTLTGNPVHGSINVKANIQAQAAVKLTDINGKVMYTGTKTFYPNSNVTIPAVGLAKGIYLLTIQSKGIKTTMKVLVE